MNHKQARTRALEIDLGCGCCSDGGDRYGAVAQAIVDAYELGRAEQAQKIHDRISAKCSFKDLIVVSQVERCQEHKLMQCGACLMRNGVFESVARAAPLDKPEHPG